MDINLTLVIQMLVFAAFVWFTMKFVWPPLARALDERQEKIAEGLASAERGRKELELAQHRVIEELKQAKLQAGELLEKAEKRANMMVEQAKQDARLEAEKVIKNAQEQMAQEINQARLALKNEVANLAVMGAEKILEKEIDKASYESLINNMIKEI